MPQENVSPDMVMPTGKYAGLTLNEIWERDPDYLLYLMCAKSDDKKYKSMEKLRDKIGWFVELKRRK